MKFLNGKNLQKVLSFGNRGYLCGDGKESQEIPEIQDDNLEMGSTIMISLPPFHPLPSPGHRMQICAAGELQGIDGGRAEGVCDGSGPSL